MLKFTIRDLLWLVLMVAMGLGWWLDRRGLAHELDRPFETNVYRQRAYDLHAEAERMRFKAIKWRQVAGALEHVLKQKGATVVWRWDISELRIEPDGLVLGTESFEPSSRPD